jgi:hypothetical protein
VSTWRLNSEEEHHHPHRRENFKSQIVSFLEEGLLFYVRRVKMHLRFHIRFIVNFCDHEQILLTLEYLINISRVLRNMVMGIKHLQICSL